MFHDLVDEGRHRGERPALITDDEVCSWGDFVELARRLDAELKSLSQHRVGIIMRPTARCFAALAALDGLGSDVFLLDGQLDPQQALRLAKNLHVEAVIWEHHDSGTDSNWTIEQLAGQQQGSGQSRVTIVTSGTSGKPKAARHSWTSLVRPVRRSPSDDVQRWLLAYRPHLYAGLQVVLQCFVNYGTLVVPSRSASLDRIVQLMRDNQVQFASATPSYWRRLVLFANRQQLSEVGFRQITLGGEVVDQQILDALRQLFPDARIVHIYATTEMGRCFSVTDGQAGFPQSFLRDEDHAASGDVQLTVREGELCVRSANAMQSYDSQSMAPAVSTTMTEDGWYRTGDLVEVRGERVYFVGRQSDIINVGGNKVSPLQVEQVVRRVAGVADVRVFAKSSSIAGQLVACEVVPLAGQNVDQLRQAVSAACQAELASFQLPRFIEVVSQIELTDAAKKLRRG